MKARSVAGVLLAGLVMSGCASATSGGSGPVPRRSHAPAVARAGRLSDGPFRVSGVTCGRLTPGQAQAYAGGFKTGMVFRLTNTASAASYSYSASVTFTAPGGTVVGQTGTGRSPVLGPGQSVILGAGDGVTSAAGATVSGSPADTCRISQVAVLENGDLMATYGG